VSRHPVGWREIVERDEKADVELEEEIGRSALLGIIRANCEPGRVIDALTLLTNSDIITKDEARAALGLH
jgi:hypothetical protein